MFGTPQRHRQLKRTDTVLHCAAKRATVTQGLRAPFIIAAIEPMGHSVTPANPGALVKRGEGTEVPGI